MLTLPTAKTIDATIFASSDIRFETVHTDWRQLLPTLSANNVIVRNLRASDAATLHAMLTTEEVARFITPPPTTVEGFEKFIAWAHRQQADGRFICFGIVPEGQRHAVGIIQVRALDAGFEVAEVGFALGSAFWGTGVFETAARMVLGFAFAELPVHRLEARAVTENGRGNGALKKIGARCEALLRRSFAHRGERVDQLLWSILRKEWTPVVH